jgi:Glycosyltransferase sugar-binding region containing DXD motif
MAQVSSFHTGRPLALWERCSLQSFADHGHRMTLYAYGPLAVPKGVTLADASAIVSDEEKDSILATAPGKFSQFSNLFRYEMLIRHGGWWVDTDVICLTDTLPKEDVWITNIKTVHNGIMHFPPDHEFLREAATQSRKRLQVLDGERRTFVGTDLLQELEASGRFQTSFVPNYSGHPFALGVGRIGELGEPALAEALGEELAMCPMLHWWSERFREISMRRDILPPRGSYLATVFERHGGTDHMDLSEWRACTAKIASGRKRKRRAQRIKRIRELMVEKTKRVISALRRQPDLS